MNYLKYFNMGTMAVMPSIVGLLIGTLIDRGVRSYPFFTVTFLIIGIMSGLWSLYKSVKDLI